MKTKKKDHKKEISFLKLWLIILVSFAIFTLGIVYFGKHHKKPDNAVTFEFYNELS
jgi:hypothetical protein